MGGVGKKKGREGNGVIVFELKHIGKQKRQTENKEISRKEGKKD